MQKSIESEIKTSRMTKAKMDAQIRELNTKLEKLENELREKT